MNQEPSRDIRTCALDALSRREHSCFELRRKLSTRGYEPELISAEIERLAADNLLDDRRYTELYIQQRVGRGFGPTRIRGELRERGVAEEIIDEALATVDVDWDHELVCAWNKKYGQRPQSYKEQSKQARFLEYRGYSTTSISKLLDGRIGPRD